MTEDLLPQRKFPATWSVCTIGQAGHIILGQTKTKPQSPGEHFPYLRVANVQDGFIDYTDVSEMAFTDPQRYALRPGDILLCEGQSIELVGRSAIYSGEPSPLLFQNHLIRFRGYSNVNPDYALSVFRAYQKSGVFASIARSTTNIAHMSLVRFRQLPFPLAPPAVQSEIADNIKAIQDILDFIGDVVSNSIPQLRDIVRSARDEEILGAQAVVADPWSESQAGSRWPVTRAGDLVPGDAPIVYGIVQPGPNVEHGVPYVRGLDLQEGYIDIDQLWSTSPDVAERYKRSELAAGDVLLNIIRHTRVAVVPPALEGANIARATARLRPNDRVTSAYLAHWLSSASAQNWLQSRMHGIDMPVLNLRDVRELPVPLPPLSVQQEMSRHLDQIVGQAGELAASFAVLDDALPSLEADLIESFAYGKAAESISRDLPDDVQTELSRSLLESLGREAADRSENIQDSDSQILARPIEADYPSNWEAYPVMQPSRGGSRSTDTKQVLEALATLGGRASPEDLYSSMRLAEAAVDSFYVVLRELVQAGRLTEIRPDNATVVLELAAVE